MKKNKKKCERQYIISAVVEFVVCDSNINEAKKFMEKELMGLNTVDFRILDCQMRIPQVEVKNESTE